MNNIKVGNIILGNNCPKICVPLVADSIDGINGEVLHALESKADLLELRIDYYVRKNGLHNVIEAVESVRKLSNMPLIFTFRTKPEGGECEITQEQYSKLILEISETGYADFADVELNMGEAFVEELIKKIKQTSTRVIVSNHDFEHTVPEDEIIRRMKIMEKIGADIAKVAMMPVCEEDVISLLDASVKMKKQLSIPIITMSMGKMGAISRLWGNLSGSVITFASVTETSAPGQMRSDKVSECIKLLNGGV